MGGACYFSRNDVENYKDPLYLRAMEVSKSKKFGVVFRPEIFTVRTI
jgi:hypothetical protein